MDPNANLKEQIALSEKIIKDFDRGAGRIDRQDSIRLAELVLALDKWISKGGALPDRWK